MDSDGGEPNGAGDWLENERENVIVGGGLGGLACTLALHRVLIISKIYLLHRWEVFDSQGKSLAKVEFVDCEGGPHELRAVDRKVLLEVLVGELPEGTILYKSCVTGIKKLERRTGFTKVELKDCSTYSTKVVIGFDGINSCVASWIGLRKAQPVGHVGLRGMAIFPEDHKFENKVQFFVGKRCRAGVIPSSQTKALWFINWNDAPQSSQNTSGEEMSKAEALQLASKLFPLTPISFIYNTLRRDSSKGQSVTG